MYPAAMAIIAVCVTVALTTVIFPKFIASLNLKEENMPGITLFVQNLSQFLMTRYIEITIGLIITGGALWYAVTKTPQGGKNFRYHLF